MSLRLFRSAAAALFLLVALPAWAADGNFIKAGQVDLMALLPPPPATESAQTHHELDELMALQKSRTPAQIKAAQADVEKSVFRFADVLGADFTADKLPLTKAFFAKIGADQVLATDPPKSAYQRPRPFVVDADLKPAVPLEKSPSYPSGHTTFGTLTGIVLANMVPEKRAAIMARAWDFGHNRMVGGVHYASDVEAGRIAGTVIADEEMKSPEFQAQFTQVKAEIRADLKLP